jgi:P27 family predicted phage terminase small subunit
MPGRRPKPTALKELAGNPGHRPLNADEPRPEPGAPEKPKGMGHAANREWDFITGALLKLGILTNVDGKALAAYCDAYGLWEQARKEINKYGLVLKAPKVDKDGNVIIVRCGEDEDWEMVNPATKERGKVLYEFKANPAVGVYNTFGKLMKAYLIEFGLTPASRSKLKIQPPKKESTEEEQFMSKTEQLAAKNQAPLAFNTGDKPGLPDITARLVAKFDA